MAEKEIDVSETLVDPVADLLTQAEAREVKARRRAFYLTLIPAALALVLLMGTSLQMRSANRAVTEIKDSLAEKQQEVLALNLELDNADEALAHSQQAVMEARQALTDTLDTLETVTGNLIAAREELAQKETELEVTHRESEALQDRLDRADQRITDLTDRTTSLEQSLESVQDELQAAIAGRLYLRDDDWQTAAENIAVLYPVAGALLQTIVDHMDAEWQPGGFSPAEGFDASGFAAYILQENDRLTLPSPEDRYRLRELLSDPGFAQAGSLVFYEGGITMFYFLDEGGVPFVIGMTTQGVIALSPGFAPVVGYGSTAP